MRIQILQPSRFIVVDDTMFIRVLDKSIGADALGENTVLVYDFENNIISMESDLITEPNTSGIESELESNDTLRETALDLDLIYIRTSDISYLNYCRSYN
jgi:hypothetical protein